MNIRKMLLLFGCLLLCLCISGCHSEMDPWPKNETALDVPTQTLTPSPTLEPTICWMSPVPTETADPAETPIPTQIPGVEVAPGLNG